jgi:hypothetical protein
MRTKYKPNLFIHHSPLQRVYSREVPGELLRSRGLPGKIEQLGKEAVI